MVRYLLLIGSMLVLSGCFAKPRPGLDYGPMPVNYEAEIEAYFETILKDPYSAKYSYRGSPVKGYCNEGLAYGGQVSWYGWAVPVQINAKNSFGAYTGFFNHWVFFNSSGHITGQVKRRTFDAVLCTRVQ